MPALDWVTRVPSAVEAVGRFHAAPWILRRLTPFVVPMSIHRLDPLAEGSISEFTLWFGPLPVRWTALHIDVDPRSGFTDVQTAGPFDFWKHTHRFEPDSDGGARIVEHVDYRHAPGSPGLLTRVLFSPPMLFLLFTYRSAVMRWSLRRPRRRVHASTSHGDSDGQRGNLILDRDGKARVAVVADGTMWERRVDLAAAPWRVPDNVVHRAETTPASPG